MPTRSVTERRAGGAVVPPAGDQPVKVGGFVTGVAGGAGGVVGGSVVGGSVGGGPGGAISSNSTKSYSTITFSLSGERKQVAVTS
jgi:hypothetical protein